MKKSIWCVRREKRGFSPAVYLKSYKIDYCRFTGEWTENPEEAWEFTKAEAVMQAANLCNEWNGKNYRPRQKCKCIR